jgi:cyclophilin family peptidyl-prolyl cis-trans isomerase
MVFVKRSLHLALPAVFLALGLGAQDRPDGIYAEIQTAKGKIVARLEPELTPVTVANFVGLAEGTIANAAFDPGRPFYDGSVFHRVVPGHVIQGGAPKSERAKGPGYTFPNEIHARLSHNHAGALNMANGGPHTNASQFCVTLGDRSYLDGDYIVFGEVVEGLDVVKRIAQGDVMEAVRITRVGSKAQGYRPTTESFRALLQAAEQRVAIDAEKKKLAEREWIAEHYPGVEGEFDGVRTEMVGSSLAPAGTGPIRVRYRGTQVRYMGHVLGRSGPPIELSTFVSDEKGAPTLMDSPSAFPVEPGKTSINPGLDSVIAAMPPGERRIAVVPAAMAYGRVGFYAPEVPGHRRFVISPETMLVYEIEVLPGE